MKAVLNDRETQLFEGLTRDQLLASHRCMLLSRKLDDKEIMLRNQSQIFFQISGAGHEGVLAAAALTLRSGYDWFFPYYRDRALCLALGVTPLEMLLAAVGAKDDPASGGRQMPSHYSYADRHIWSVPTPTGSQLLPACGIAWGINNGVLDRATFLPVVQKAWTGLVSVIDTNGMVGWCQPVGAGPAAATATSTTPFGVGAWLLAASEMAKLLP